MIWASVGEGVVMGQDLKKLRGDKAKILNLLKKKMFRKGKRGKWEGRKEG